MEKIIKKPTITIGIPTYYGGLGLVKTIESICQSREADQFRLIVCVDGNPLEPEIEARLRALGVEIVLSNSRGGQRARIKQMVALCDSDVLILTQDDIIFSKKTISEIRRSFLNDPNLTMVAGYGAPGSVSSFFEKIINISALISKTIGEKWNEGDNYLQISGRCLAFRTAWIKKMPLEEKILNSDINFYFTNRKMGGKFRQIPSAVFSVRSPKTLAEHLKQSKKFQLMKHEVRDYCGIDVKLEQAIPVGLIFFAVGKSFLFYPIETICYAGIWVYSRLVGNKIYQHKKPYWETDVTTKNN